jgi:hypothetical protein
VTRVLIWVLFGLYSSSAYCGSVSHYVGDKQCNIEFDYPSNWQVTRLPNEKDVTCQVQIRRKDYLERMKKNGDSEDSYTLVLQVFDLSFLWAADQSGFDFYQGEWATIGRQGMRDTATVIKTKRWSGVKGVATAGCVLSKPIDGVGVVPCNEYRAVLQDDYNDVWALSGGTDTEPAFEMILSSFKFSGN